MMPEVIRCDNALSGPWIGVLSAAARAGCHAQTIRRAIRAGRIPAGRIGSHFRVRVEDIDQWIASQAGNRRGGEAAAR